MRVVLPKKEFNKSPSHTVGLEQAGR